MVLTAVSSRRSWTAPPIVFTPGSLVSCLTDKEEIELNLRLNKNSGSWNFDGLLNLDDDLLKDVGFTELDMGLIEAKEKGNLLYYHKEVECPHCHKHFKKPIVEDSIPKANK